jgi:phosphoribosylglycinamide formyltransferase 1
MKNIVVLISGRGSNLEALVHACARERWDARIAAVVSNRPEAPGLRFSEAHGIASAVVDHREHPDREGFDAQLLKTVQAFEPDWVVLAGFMRILTPVFISPFAGRLINIHPSLLPSFPGLNTHQRALDAGCKVAGATVHFVTPELDHGPILCQAVVPVLVGDSAQLLAQRVLQQEHIMLPTAVRWLLHGEVSVDALGGVQHKQGQPQLFGYTHRN